MEPKKLIILRILQILEQYSDEDHPLTQQDIIVRLEREYGVVCERKAVGRNLSYLREAGYDIAGGADGVYLLTRRFERSELRLLIDSVLTSRYIDKKHSEDLIRKLLKEGGEYFKAGCKHLYYNKEWNKSENKVFFYNIELLDEAIEKKNKISCYYLYYDVNKKLIKKEHPYFVSPYQLLLHNQRYYLICNIDKYDNMCYLRVDRMTGIEILDSTVKPLKSIDGYADGLHLSHVDTAFPYMYDDREEKITLYCKSSIMGDLIDWFGKSFYSKPMEDGRIKAVIFGSPAAMKYWALQYGDAVEVTEPRSLRGEIKETVKRMQQVYLD